MNSGDILAEKIVRLYRKNIEQYEKWGTIKSTYSRQVHGHQYFVTLCGFGIVKKIVALKW